MDIFSLFDRSPEALALVVAVLGLLIGSFLNVVVYRLPLMMEREWRQHCAELFDQQLPSEEAALGIVKPGSHCPQCGRRIRPWENVPVLSYLALRGRCAGCSASIPARYPLVEALTGILSASVAWQFGLSWEMVAALIFTWTLIALTFIDLDHQLLPDNLTLPLLWLGILAATWGLFTDLRSSVLGAVAGYGFLWIVYQLFRLTTGKEGMGYGDFKLFALIGAWLGWQLLPVVLVMASAVGALFGMAMIAVRGHDRSIPIPFGPYLAAAGWIGLMWGMPLTNAYLHWLRPI